MFALPLIQAATSSATLGMMSAAFDRSTHDEEVWTEEWRKEEMEGNDDYEKVDYLAEAGIS